MKKMYKQVLALVLTMVLMFCCTAFASAKEAPVDAINYVEGQTTGGDEGIMPLDIHIFSAGGGYTTTSTETGRASALNAMGYRPYFYVTVAKQCSFQVKLSANDGQVLCYQTFTAREGVNLFWLSSSKMAAKNYTLEFFANKSGISYSWEFSGQK